MRSWGYLTFPKARCIAGPQKSKKEVAGVASSMKATSYSLESYGPSSLCTCFITCSPCGHIFLCGSCKANFTYYESFLCRLLMPRSSCPAPTHRQKYFLQTCNLQLFPCVYWNWKNIKGLDKVLRTWTFYIWMVLLWREELIMEWCHVAQNHLGKSWREKGGLICSYRCDQCHGGERVWKWGN